MAVIDFKVFGYGSKKCLRLGNEEYVRPIQALSWTRLRLGALIALVPDGTNNIANITMAMGLCSGYSGFSLVDTTNAICGSYSNSTTWAGTTLTYNAGSGNPYFNSGTGTLMMPWKRVAGVTTFLSGAASNVSIAATTGSVQRATPFFVDIVKGSPNYTVDVYGSAVLGQTTNTTFDQFYDAFEQNSTAPIIQGSTLSRASNAGSFSEATYALTSFFFYWQKSLTPVEIYALGVSRLA